MPGGVNAPVPGGAEAPPEAGASASVHAGGSAFDSARSDSVCARPVPSSCRRSDSIDGAPAPDAAFDKFTSALSGALVALPACQRTAALCTVMRPSRSALASSWPVVASTGQRPARWALAFRLPASWASGPGVRNSARTGARRSSDEAFTLTSQASFAPLPAAVSRPCARTLLPATSSRTVDTSRPSAALRNAASPVNGTPASRLSVIEKSASPRTAASQPSRGNPARVAGKFRATVPLAFRRLTALRQAASSRPGHQTLGSKSTSAARAFTDHGAAAAACVATPTIEARPPPARSCRSRTSMRCGFTPASSTSCTARGLPRSATVPARLALTSMGSGPTAVAPGPPPVSASVPFSCMTGARASSWAGCSASSVASRFQRSRVQRPEPVMRPALFCDVPSSAARA